MSVFLVNGKISLAVLLRVHLISCLLSLKQRQRILLGIGGQVLKQAMKS